MKWTPFAVPAGSATKCQLVQYISGLDSLPALAEGNLTRETRITLLGVKLRKAKACLSALITTHVRNVRARNWD